MGNKTVIVILCACALLLGFIFFFEQDTMTTGQRSEREERVFQSFRRDHVDSLTIEGTGGGAVVLEKVASAVEEESDNWKVVSPRKLVADKREVDSVLSAIDYLIAKRTIKGKEEKANTRYGLESPRLKGSFTAGGQKTSFVLGADASGEAIYLAVDGAEEFYAVETAFLESVDKAIGDLRSKQIVTDDLEDAVGIDVKNGEVSYQLRSEQGASWQVETEGSWILAAASQVHELLHALNDLKAVSFVKDGVDGETLGEYGLGPGGPSIEVRLRGDKKVDLRVGTPCANEPHQVHVGILGSGMVVCVEDGFLQVVSRPGTRFRETRPFISLDDDVTKITLTRSGKELVVTKEEEGWQLAGDVDFPMDQGTVADLLGALRQTHAEEISVGEELVSNLGQPTARVKVELVVGSAVDLSFFSDEASNKLFVRRGDEVALLTVSPKLLDQVRPEKLAFRKRKIRSGSEFDIENLKIAGPLKQELVKTGGAWKLVKPLEIEADGMGVRRVTELLSEITVERFVANEADAEHGFAKPFAVIEAKFAAEDQAEGVVDRTTTDKIVLELGAMADKKNRFARLRGKDKTVFVVGETYVNAINTPLVARDLLQIGENQVVQMTLTSDRGELSLKKQDGTWKADGNPEIDGTGITRLLTDLGGMKTIRADSFHGFTGPDKPMLTLQIWNEAQVKNSSPDTFYFIKRTSDPKEDGYYACLNDLKVTFVLPARIVDELIALNK